MNADILGYIAGTITIISFVPQIIKSYKTKRVKDLSILMLLMIMASILLWLIYGILVGNKPIIIVNGIYVLVVAFQFYLKIRYNRSGPSRN